MADSMCGPSNALQSFQKHSTVDRTLQQDRLVGRPSPAQGFRSTPGPSAGLLDHEFEAFQAGQLPIDHGFQSQHSFSHAPTPSLQQAGPSNWASDFQRMNISSPPPQFSQLSFDPQVQQRHDSGGWHQEFARQQNLGVDQSMGQMPYQRYSPMSGMMGSHLGGFAVPQAEMSIAQQKQPEEAFDEAAFAKAFEEAANAEMESQQLEHTETVQDSAQSAELGQDILIEESAEKFMASGALLDQERIGADSIYDPVLEELGRDQDDPNALAKTAGHLLESIRHEQSSKFQNSQFLELMRQFRDGQATVEGDTVVGLNTDESGLMGDEESKTSSIRRAKELEHFTRTLKKMVLDRDRPFQRSPENVKLLLDLLLRMERVMKGVDAEAREVARSRRHLEAVVNCPEMKDLPSVRALAGYYLEASVASTAQSEELYAIAEANKQIISFYDPVGKGDDVVGRFIAAQLSGDKEIRNESLGKLLGYEILRNPHSKGNVEHERRAEDILGRAVSCVREVCRRRGWFCEELSVETFFKLVESYEVYDKSGGKYDRVGFVYAMFRAEREIERRLSGVMGELERQRDLGQGLGEAGEQRARDCEEQLKYMWTQRQRYPFPTEEGWLDPTRGGWEHDGKGVGIGANVGLGKADLSGHLSEMINAGHDGAEEMRDRAEEAVGLVRG